jgi:hypothetical protein
MAKIIPTTIVAVFPHRGEAEAAIDQLWHAGFAKDDIGMALPGEDFRQATTPTGPTEERAATGAAAGAAVGTALGAVAGTVAMVTLPGLGAILVGGALMGIATGAAAGAALGTFAGPFVALGISKEAAHRYEKAFRDGRSVVVVRARRQPDTAVVILKSHGPASLEVAGNPLPLPTF